MIKVTYIISDINKAIAFEWIADSLDREQFELTFILLNSSEPDIAKHLSDKGLKVYNILCRGKKDWVNAVFKTRSLLQHIKPEVVHCHLFQANIIGLVAAKLTGIQKRIYTRHHSSLHHVYFKKGVLWDKLCNLLATHIIAITKNVRTILIDWEKAKASKVVLIPHGFDLEEFEYVQQDRICHFKKKHCIEGKAPVIGVISRFTKWKGVQFIIPAFKQLLHYHPNAVLMLLNAHGDYENEIKKYLADLSEDTFRLIPFENDIAAAYKNMDIFIHVPIDDHSEAFGQIYVEALAAGVPSIFTLSGIATDFIRHQENAYVVPFQDANANFLQMRHILSNPDLVQEVREQGIKDVKQNFSLKTMIYSLEKLYARQ